MTRDDRLFLAEIVTACDEIASTLQAIDKQTFLSDIVVQGFVLNRLTIIGEAASKISDAIRDRHVEVPWKAIIAMRNIVVHQYFAIDWAIIWDAANVDTPKLRQQISNIISQKS